MKKAALFAFAVLSTCMLSSAAYADAPRSEKFPDAGITLNFTPEFEETKGVIVPYGGVDVGGGIGIYETDLFYFALDQEEYDRLENPFAAGNFALLITIISADNGITLDDLKEFAGGSLDSAELYPICTVEDCTHFSCTDPDEALPEGTDTVYVEEYENLRNSADLLFANSEFLAPSDPLSRMIGSKIEFRTTDTEGNPVTSEELFGSHEITMVNIWASWCGFCIDEMEELEKISGRLAEKDCAVVGLLSDGDEEAALASGKEILEEKGVTYLNLLPPENLYDIFYIAGYPTTYFVNREGVIIGTPIVGAYIDQYEPAVEALLAGNESAAGDLLSASADEAEEEAGTEEAGRMAARIDTNEDSLYRVIVIDEDGNPVPGVNVQFCSDTACMLGETDETGTAVFREEKGLYTVHILKAPEEYIAVEEEYYVEEFCDLTIFLYREK